MSTPGQSKRTVQKHPHTHDGQLPQPPAAEIRRRPPPLTLCSQNTNLSPSNSQQAPAEARGQDRPDFIRHTSRATEQDAAWADLGSKHAPLLRTPATFLSHQGHGLSGFGLFSNRLC